MCISTLSLDRIFNMEINPTALTPVTLEPTTLTQVTPTLFEPIANLHTRRLLTLRGPMSSHSCTTYRYNVCETHQVFILIVWWLWV